jgi:hypothetical protein
MCDTWVCVGQSSNCAGLSLSLPEEGGAAPSSAMRAWNRQCCGVADAARVSHHGGVYNGCSADVAQLLR